MNSASQTLHPVAICQVMINFAASYGVDQDTCLLGTGIEPDILEDAEALISAEQELRLVENLILALPDVSALGIKLGLSYHVSTFGVWGFALRTSRDLRAALKHALQFLPLSTAYCRIQMVETGAMLGIALDPSGIPRQLRQFLLERDLATAINIVNEISLAGSGAQRLQLQVPTLEYAEEIETLCGIEPELGCSRNMLLMPRAEAEKPLSTFDARLVRMLEDRCRQQLEQRQQSGVTGQVRAQLLGEQGLVANLEDVARELAISPRGLRRKLRAEGTTFRHVLEEERRQLAMQLLGESDITLDEVAAQLGYADTASFNRAFRRWLDISPGGYRNQTRST